MTRLVVALSVLLFLCRMQPQTIYAGAYQQHSADSVFPCPLGKSTFGQQNKETSEGFSKGRSDVGGRYLTYFHDLA